MKKYYILGLLFFSISLLTAQSRPDTLWTKSLGGSSVEGYGYYYSMKSEIDLTADQKFLYVTSTTASNDGYVNRSLGNMDGWIVKLDAQTGDTIWTAVLGGSGWDALSDVAVTPDGGCVVCGYSNSQDGDFEKCNYHYNPDLPNCLFTDGFIAKYSADGKLEWTQMYGGQPLFEELLVGTDELYKIIVTKDGGYMAVGYTYSITDDIPVDYEKFNGGWLLKVDSNGKIENSDKFTGENHNEFNNNTLWDIVEVQEDLYYVVGEQGYIEEISAQLLLMKNYIWVIKTDGVKILDQAEYGSIKSESYAKSIVKGPDNTFFVAGICQSATGDIDKAYSAYDIWLLQIDTDLNLVDQNTFGGSTGEYPYQLVSDNKGHYLITAYTNSPDFDAGPHGYGVSDFWAIIFDDNLDSLQTYRIGGEESDKLTDAVFSADGKTLYVSGLTYSNDSYVNHLNGSQDIWVAAIAQNTALSVETPKQEDGEDLRIFPNPSNGIFNILDSKNENISISDITGKIIFSRKIQTDNEEIIVPGLRKGIYFVKFSDNQVRKIIID